MKRLALILALTVVAAGTAAGAVAQDAPPALPKLSAQQSADVEQQLSLYRTEVNGRVARGEITAAEGERLIGWRHWQLAQAAVGSTGSGASVPPGPIANEAPSAGDVPPGPIAEDTPPRVIREYYYRPYYYPPPAYYAPPPVYYAPVPYYWGPRVCAGGFGRHFGGRFCF